MINVVIPAAGVGTRLRPHTHTAPKALLQVAGKPILGHILDRLAGLKDLGSISLVVGFLADQIRDYVEKNHQLTVRFVHQDKLLGLGYAVHLALEQIENDDPVLVILGDTILETDLVEFMSGPDDALGVKEVEDPRRFGVAETEGNRITNLVEKPAEPPSNLAVVGLYGIKNTALLRRCLQDVIAGNRMSAGELQMTDALKLMIDRGSNMVAKRVDGWFDCGKLETLLLTNRHLLEKHTERYEMDDSIVIPPSYISPSARIARSIIGPHVSVGDHASVSESIIANSIISNGADVRRCLLEDSMIGANAIVSGHNQRFNVGDSSEVGIYR